jgi:hypothetical protein
MTETPIIVGIHGPLRSGKDTFAAHLIEHYGFIRLGFADALKAEVMQRFGGSLRAYVKAAYPGVSDTYTAQWVYNLVYTNRDQFSRTFIQEYGTDLRRQDNPRYWVDRWMEGVNCICTEGHYRIVAPDTRFLNEYDQIRVLHGYLVKINPRPVALSGLPGHPSESPLPGPWHFVAANTGDAKALQEEADIFAKSVLKL